MQSKKSKEERVAEISIYGQRAHELLHDEVLNAVFAGVADHYRTMWETAPRADLEKQQLAHCALAGLKDCIATLRAHLGNAQLLEADLAAARMREERTPINTGRG